MTADLTEFILARIADREQVARDLANWTNWEVPIFRLFDDDPESQADLDAKDYAKVFAQLMRAHEVPARVLAECKAIREIVARYEQAERLRQANAEKHAEVSRGGLDNQEQIMALRVHGYELQGRLDGLLYAVTALAAIWADHEDYRPEEWA